MGTGSLLPQSDAVEMTEKLSGGHRNTSNLSMCGRGLWKGVFHGWKAIQTEHCLIDKTDRIISRHFRLNLKERCLIDKIYRFKTKIRKYKKNENM